MTTKTCTLCGLDITKQAYLFKGKNQFCNDSCKMKYLNAGTPIIKKLTKYIQTRCENCGKKIELNHRQLLLETVHFCVEDCKKVWLERHGIEVGHRFAPPQWTSTEEPIRMSKSYVFFQGERYEVNSPYQSS